jgi:hypothetical protein
MILPTNGVTLDFAQPFEFGSGTPALAASGSGPTWNFLGWLDPDRVTNVATVVDCVSSECQSGQDADQGHYCIP